MSGVLLPDGTYGVKRRTETMDDSRTPVAGFPKDPDWTGEGYSNQRPDRSWVIALDPASWPLKYGDRVVLPDGTEVVVRTANLNPNDPDPQWDEVRAVDVTAVLASLAHVDREEQGG